MVPLAGIVTAPLQALVGIAATYNTLLLLSFALGGLFMFMLSKYLVNNNYSAFIAGLIFAFSPMHIAQSYSHLQWTMIEFIPLFILFFLMMVKTKKRRYALYAAIAFILLTFMGDIEQGIIMVFFCVVSLVLMALLERNEVFNKEFIKNMALLGILILVLGSPFFILMSGRLSGSLSSAGQLSDIAHNMLYSDNLLSFFLPSYYNGIFHNLAQGYVYPVYTTTYQGINYSPDITEKVSYLGYAAIVLAILALYHEHRKNRLRDIRYWIGIFVVFVLMALGPNIQLGSIATGIPTLYSVYRAVPLFNLVREPGRFDVIVTVALAILAAIGFDHLSKTKYGKNAILLALVFSAIIFIEYNGMPLSASFAGQLTTNAQIPQLYKSISSVGGNFSVLVLPALPNLTSGSFLYPGESMYYQTSFMKPILGGYTTRENSTQQQLLENVPLIVSSSYLESGYGFIYPYPILENYSRLSLFWLTANKVGMVAVINNAYASAYNQSRLSGLLNYLYGLFGNPVYEDSNVTIFDSGLAENAGGENNMVSYISGVWVPGYQFCTASQPCNTSFASMWYGNNVRAITVFAPKNTSATVRMEGMTYYPSAPVEVFLNNNNLPLSSFLMNETARNYSANILLPEGLSQRSFYQSNATFGTRGYSPYLNFGLRNITVSGN